MFQKIKAKIKASIAYDQVVENELLRYAYSTDASLYRMIPKLVLIVRNEQEVVEVIKLANIYGIKLTFRTAGTSLSGQAVTDEVLVVLAADSWLKYEVYNKGFKLKLESSIIGAEANRYLKIYDRKIGPDPGSIDTAKIGGIIANNSSGMCCGVAKNSYSTLYSMRIIFADGYVLDTAKTKSIDEFKKNKKKFIDSILSIRQQILDNQQMASFLKKKFSIKNTSGYSLNAFLDFDDPIKIIERLIVGSEGTLGFISNVILNTVPEYKHKALNLIYGRLDDLIELTLKLKLITPSAVELLDYVSLKSVSNIEELQPFLIPLKDKNIAAIMVELAEDSKENLYGKLEVINEYTKDENIFHQAGFRTGETEMKTLWRARNGVLPTIAGQRPRGSSVLTEDVAVNILDLPNLILDIKRLFIKYDYLNAAIFGHVLAGNVHFILTPDFNDKNQIIKYDGFMHEFTSLVAKKYNGSLKSEHGSGRNISPFAIVEWGEKCWDIMWQIKKLFDLNNILNPDVKLTKDKKLHIKNLKELNNVDDQIDKCMECGFCEPVCPSRNISLSPRQRNTVARKIETLEGLQKKQWLKDFDYYGVKTCATTSLCKMRCPVDIDTGAYILSRKIQNNKSLNHAKQINYAKQKVSLGNIVGSVVGKKNLQYVTQQIHSKFKSIPIYS